MLYQTIHNSHYEKIGKEVRCIDDEIPFDIPGSWMWCRIRDISQSYIGLTYSPSEVSNIGVIVLRSSNIKDGRIVLNDIVRVSKDNISDKLFVSENDILICARNGSKRLVGKSAKIPALSEKMVFGAFMAICKTPFHDFVYSFLQSSLFYNQLNNVSGTTTINQLTQNNFNGFIIPIPPLTEQKRIVQKLEELSPLLNDYNKIEEEDASLSISLSDTLNKSILQYAIQGKLVSQDPTDEPASVLLERIREEKKRLVKDKKIKADRNDSIIYKGDDNSYYEKIGATIRCIDDEVPFKIPDSWCWIRHNEIFEVSGGSQPPKSKFIEHEQDGYIRLYQIRDYGKNPQPIYIPTETATKLTNKGDILLARYGASLGKVFFAEEGAYNVAMAKVIPLFNKVDICYDYLYLYYKSNIYQYTVLGKARSAQAGFNKDDLQNMLFPLPPLQEQYRIVKRLEQMRENYNSSRI